MAEEEQKHHHHLFHHHKEEEPKNPEEEYKHHKHLEHLGEGAAVAAGVYALVIKSLFSLDFTKLLDVTIYSLCPKLLASSFKQKPHLCLRNFRGTIFEKRIVQFFFVN